jgi:hypothetical protein
MGRCGVDSTLERCSLPSDEVPVGIDRDARGPRSHHLLAPSSGLANDKPPRVPRPTPKKNINDYVALVVLRSVGVTILVMRIFMGKIERHDLQLRGSQIVALTNASLATSQRANPIDLLFIRGRCTPRRSYVTTHEVLGEIHAGGAGSKHASLGFPRPPFTVAETGRDAEKVHGHCLLTGTVPISGIHRLDLLSSPQRSRCLALECHEFAFISRPRQIS